VYEYTPNQQKKLGLSKEEMETNMHEYEIAWDGLCTLLLLMMMTATVSLCDMFQSAVQLMDLCTVKF
jgi:hypothetical protein